MKFALVLFVGASLAIGSAYADDHHFQAIQSGGLFFDVTTFSVVNKAGHAVPDSPGQASPFTGAHLCTPATDTGAAQDNANVKPKGTDDPADCAED